MALRQLGARYAGALNVNIDDVMRCLESLQTTHLANSASDQTSPPASHTAQARFPSKRNRLRCVRCVRCVWMETGLNASACVDKQPIMVATALTEHPIGCV